MRVNGQSVSARYQPGSYVTLPPRRWKATDRIDVVMPFTPHIDFGPDKMEVAATGKNKPRTRFEPAWCGAVMNGPLVLAAQGVKTWDEATVRMTRSARRDAPYLENDEVQMTNEGARLTNGGLQTADGKSLALVPDYDADRHCTHYFRFLMPGEPAPAVAEASAAGEGVDDSRLREAMALARSRRDAQNAWNALEVKVPEYAPWAPHGYARLMEQFDRARALYDDAERSHSQTAIDQMATDLNAAIATMRPGNLPELEDLDELLPLLARGREVKQPSAKLREAVDYAEMVVKYVSDGSGTADMIARATRQLSEALR